MIRKSDFNPAWWLPSRHLQTILPNFLRPRIAVTSLRQRLEFPDGDFADIDWVGTGDGPLVVVLHGLEGSIESRYAAAILQKIASMGWRGALLHFRGCSGEPNRLERSYHSGDTADIDYFLRQFRQREPETPICALGYSLGGNVLLKWLGETADSGDLLSAACAVSVPFDLGKAADTMHQGFARMYETMLLRRLKQSILAKSGEQRSRFTEEDVCQLRSIREFDECVTAPLNGFAGANDYYERCSSRQFLGEISLPTLILHASDDPFMTPDTVPSAQELSGSVVLELSDHGGHVGFVTGNIPFRPRYWLEQRIPDFFEEYLV